MYIFGALAIKLYLAMKEFCTGFYFREDKTMKSKLPALTACAALFAGCATAPDGSGSGNGDVLSGPEVEQDNRILREADKEQATGIVGPEFAFIRALQDDGTYKFSGIRVTYVDDATAYCYQLASKIELDDALAEESDEAKSLRVSLSNSIVESMKNAVANDRNVRKAGNARRLYYAGKGRVQHEDLAGYEQDAIEALYDAVRYGVKKHNRMTDLETVIPDDIEDGLTSSHFELYFCDDRYSEKTHNKLQAQQEMAKDGDAVNKAADKPSAPGQSLPEIDIQLPNPMQR